MSDGVYGKKPECPMPMSLPSAGIRLGMNGNQGGAEAPMAFSLGRTSDLWSEFFTISKNRTDFFSAQFHKAMRFVEGNVCPNNFPALDNNVFLQ